MSYNPHDFYTGYSMKYVTTTGSGLRYLVCFDQRSFLRASFYAAHEIIQGEVFHIHNII